MDQLDGLEAANMWQTSVRDNVEHLPGLTPAEVDSLLNGPGIECTFAWIDKHGYPLTSAMGYVMVDGKLRMSCARTRVKLRRLQDDSRCSVTVSNHAGPVELIQAVTLVGRARQSSADSLRQRVHAGLARGMGYRTDSNAFRAVVDVMNSMDRVIVTIDPVERVYTVNGAALTGTG